MTRPTDPIATERVALRVVGATETDCRQAMVELEQLCGRRITWHRVEPGVGGIAVLGRWSAYGTVALTRELPLFASQELDNAAR